MNKGMLHFGKTFLHFNDQGLLNNTERGNIPRFLLQVFFVNPQPPKNNIRVISNFSHKFAQIRCQLPWWQLCLRYHNTDATTLVANLPPVSTSPTVNFPTGIAGVLDTGGKLPPVSMILAANFWSVPATPPVSMTPPVNLSRVSMNGNHIIPTPYPYLHLKENLLTLLPIGV